MDWVTSPGGSCDLSALVAGGKYRILITPYFGAAANLTLILSTTFKAEMIVNGPWQVFDTNRIGKRARFTFRGRQGGNNILDWSGSTFPSSSVIAVFRPNGVSLNAPYIGYSISNPNTTIPLPLLPETGDYVVFIDPRDINVGSISVRIRGDVAPPLPVPDQGDIPIPPWANPPKLSPIEADQQFF